MNRLAANIVAVVLTVLFCAAGVVLAHLLPHHAPWAEWHAFALLASVVALTPFHEALHALGLLWYAKVSWNHIRFGVMWRTLMPYCHCTVPIPVCAYRRMALLPLWVTGAATSILLFLFPTDWLGLLAGTTIAACVGDVWVVAKLRRFKDDWFVKDCASAIGCDVFSAIA